MTRIICTAEQLEEEFAGAVDLINYIAKCLGLENEISFRFSRWDSKDADKYIGTAEQWEAAERVMKNILTDLGIVHKEAIGEATFYSPKLDVQACNVHGKEDRFSPCRSTSRLPNALICTISTRTAKRSIL